MRQSLLLFISFLMVSIASAQKVEVFEKAQKPEFQAHGKNAQVAQGYGYIRLNSGDTLKGALKVEKKDNLVSSYSIKSKKKRYDYTYRDVSSYGFYPYHVFTYDPQIPGNPNFYPGYVITHAGVKINGQVAIMNVIGTEWTFFPKKIYFIPDKTDIASSVKGGDLLVISQKVKGENLIFDAFDDGYLQRIVSGTLRLSYNPNPKGITQPLFYEQLSELDTARINALHRYVEESINEGKPLGEVIRSSGKDTPVSAGMSVGSTELIEKAYFLKDTRTGKIYMLNEENFKSILESLYSKCLNTSVSKTTNKEDLYNFKKIEESISWFNANCK